MTSSYRGYAQKSDTLDNRRIPDPSQKILQRNQEFLEDMREVRKFERQQEAVAFQQLDRNTKTQADAIDSSLGSQIEGNQRVLDARRQNTEKKKEALRLKMEGNRSGGQGAGKKDFMSIATGLAEFSKTLGTAVGDIRKAQATEKLAAESDNYYGSEHASQKTVIPGQTSLVDVTNLNSSVKPDYRPVTPQSRMGQEEQEYFAGGIAAEQYSNAAYLSLNNEPLGSLQQYQSAAMTNRVRTSQADNNQRIETQAGVLFATKNYPIKMRDGSVKMSQDMTVSEQSDNRYRIMAHMFQDMGINPESMDRNVRAKLYEKADQSLGTYFSTKARGEIEAFKSNEVQDSLLLFKDEPTPINANGVYMSFFRKNNGDDAKAREQMFEELESNNYTDAEVDTVLNTKVVGRKESWAELFPGDVQGLQTRRSANDLQVAQALDNERQVVDLERANAITEQAIIDLKDGVYNGANPEQLRQQIAKFEAEGSLKSADALRKLIPQTASAQNDVRVEGVFNELLANGVQGDLTPKMVLESGMSDKKKTEWLKKVQDFDATAPGKATVDAAKEYISDALKGRSKFNSYTSTADPSINRAISSGLEQYNRDYKQAMLQDGMTPSKAAEYALGRFQAEFGSDPLKGRYRIGNPADGQPGSKTSFIDPSFAVTPTQNDYDLNIVSLNRALTVPNAIDQPGLINYDVLKDVSVKSLTKKGMPASIQYIASRSNQPAFSILNRQLKANKLAPIPEAVYTAAQEAQNTVTGELQALLNQYPSPTRTDIAMIGSGQQAIYTQLQPTQRQGLDILAKYESGSLGYDAMNEAGTDGGRTATGSGNAVTKLGKSFTQMTIAEVMGHQAAGRLHAAGRYQFIGPTLAEQVQKLGIPPTALFNQEMQDYMASEYAKQVGWRGIWIGPTDKATPQEAAVLDAMSAADAPGVPPWRQARNMNPSVVAMTVRTKEQGPGSGYWKWDVQRKLWVKSNADQ